MSKDGTAERIADLLGIKYAHAVRLVRTINNRSNAEYVFSDLAHACRELMEEEAKAREVKPKGASKRRRHGALPKGAGAVRCPSCKAEARADGQGTAIVLVCDPDCPTRYYPKVKGHRYDAGNPRDDSKGCIFVLEALDEADEDVVCGMTEARHKHSEYVTDECLCDPNDRVYCHSTECHGGSALEEDER